MATKAATWHFCDGSIVENVHGPKLYNCTKLNAIEKVNVFSAYHPNIWKISQLLTVSWRFYSINQC